MFAMIDAMGVPRTPTLDELVTATPPAAIAEALAWVDREHGGSAAYLRSGGSPIAALRRADADALVRATASVTAAAIRRSARRHGGSRL